MRCSPSLMAHAFCRALCSIYQTTEEHNLRESRKAGEAQGLARRTACSASVALFEKESVSEERSNT
jgi:hypothetical protein